MLDRILGDRFLTQLLATERGSAFMLAFMADAEESDEQGVFETLMARVDDAKLRGLVRIHMEDEMRHAARLRICLARRGTAAPHIPSALRYVARIDAGVGGGSLAERFTSGGASVMEAYVFLGAIEERAVREWPAIVRAFRRVGDDETAHAIAEIIEDEKRHVLYSKAIARRYAPDDATLAAVSRAFHVAEDRAYAAQRDAFSRYCVEQGLLAGGPLELAFWRAASARGEAVHEAALAA